MRTQRILCLLVLLVGVISPVFSHAEVNSPSEMEQLAVEEMIKEAMKTTSACDCDIKGILKTLKDIQQRKQGYLKRSEDIHVKLMRFQEKLIKKAAKESKDTGVSLANTASGQAFSVGIAFSFDLLDDVSGFMSEAYSGLGAAATAGRGLYRAAKAPKAAKAIGKAISAGQGLSRLVDETVSKYDVRLPSRYIQYMKELTRNLGSILDLERLESQLWEKIFSNEDCLGRIKAICNTEGIDFLYYKEDRLRELLDKVYIPYYPPPDDDYVYEAYGLKALGDELGFSRERDDPLSIRNYVIPKLSEWRSIVDDVRKLRGATGEVFSGVFEDAKNCRLCRSLTRLKMMHELEIEINRFKSLLKSNIVMHQRHIFGSYNDIKRLWEKSLASKAIDITHTHPAYILSTTAISLFVPWTGTGFAIGEATLKSINNAIDVMVKSDVDREIRDNIKKFNFFIMFLQRQDVAGELSSVHKNLLKEKMEFLEELLKCEIEECSEERLYLTVPESHNIKVSLSKAIKGLEGCWTFKSGGVDPFVDPLDAKSLHIEGAPIGYRAWYVYNNQKIPLDVSFDDGLMVLTHIFNEKTLEVRGDGPMMEVTHNFDVRDEIHSVTVYSDDTISPDERKQYWLQQFFLHGAKLTIKLRPYETRSGIIAAMAMRMEDNLYEISKKMRGESKIQGRQGDAWRGDEQAMAMIEAMEAAEIEARERVLEALNAARHMHSADVLIKLAGHPMPNPKKMFRPKILDASSKREISEIGYGEPVIIQYAIGQEVNCPVARDSVFVRLSPEEDPTIAKWILLEETGKESGILQSPLILIDFYLPGDENGTVSLLPQDAHQDRHHKADDYGASLTVKGIGGIKPIEPGTDEAFRYAIASQVSVFEEIVEAQSYAQLDPLFGEDKEKDISPSPVTPSGRSQGGSMFTPPQIKIPTMPPPVKAYPPPYKQGTAGQSMIPANLLKKTPVKVPVRINKATLAPGGQHLIKTTERIDEKYRMIKPLTVKPEWADSRVRQLWLLKMNYEKEKASYSAFKDSLKKLPPQTRKQVEGFDRFSARYLENTEKKIKELEASLREKPAVLYKKRVK